MAQVETVDGVTQGVAPTIAEESEENPPIVTADPVTLRKVPTYSDDSDGDDS